MKSPDRPVPSFEFGLVAWLEATRVVLPLKGVECRFQVTGTIACVELDQIYHQNAKKPLDCTYTFPLPAGAAVYRCELHVNGRVIRAKVEEQGVAKRIFREQKEAGRRVAMVETERENLFTLSLGNVQPEDLIVVRFAWFQVLDREAEHLRLRVPTCPGVRYISGEPLLRGASGRGAVDDTDQVPDASRVTPPRIDALHPDAAYFSMEGRLSAADAEGATVSSPSHAVFVRETGGEVAIALSGRGTVPDRDFVLAWREPRTRELVPQAWRWTEGKETYALVQLRAPVGVQAASGCGQDFYFLVDRSGSMAGAKWQRTCEALRAFVGLLGVEDRVWITLFESSYRDFAEAPMAAPAVLADRGFQRMEALGTAGGTELLPAAKHVLEKIAAHSTDRRASVVLITDGQVGNEATIASAFARTPEVRVHAFGIDTAVNDAFLKELARRHRGGCWLQTPDDDIAGTIAALGSRLQRPVLTDLTVRGSWQTGGERWPDLHAEEVVAIAVRGRAGKSLEIRGRLPDGSEHRFVVKLGNAGSEAVKLLWARERIAALLESHQPAKAIALAREFNLICKGAAFIAWDEAEQVQIAKEEMVQPVLEPACALHAAAPRMACCFVQDSDDHFHAYAGKSISREEWERPADVSRQVREAYQRLGVSTQTISEWLAEAQNKSDRLMLPALLLAASTITDFKEGAATGPLLWKRLEPGMRKALSGSVANLLKWHGEALTAVNTLHEIERVLMNANVPADLIDCLNAWIFESGLPDRARLRKIESLGKALENAPFSATATLAIWERFLDDAVERGSETYVMVASWLSQSRVEKAAVT